MSQFFQTVEGGLPPAVPTSIVTDVGTAVAQNHVLNVNGDTGVVVSVDPDGSNNIIVSINEIIPTYTDVVNPNIDHSAYVFIANTTDDYYISVDTTLGPVTIKFPDSGSVPVPPSNSQFVVKDRTGTASTYNITIESENGLATIENNVSYIFVDSYESLECIYHNNNYEIF